MKTILISFLIFLFAEATHATTLRYEGVLAGPAITSGTLSGESFQVGLRRPDCSSNLGLSTVTVTSDIVDGKFAISPSFDSDLFAAAMDPSNTFGGTCTGASADRELVITWNSQTFFVPITDAPKSALAHNALKLGGITPSGFLKIEAASSYTPLTSAQVNSLLDLVSGTSTQYLQSTTNFSGDVTGNAGATVVDKIRGTAVASTAPSTGQVLKFDGTTWVPSADATGTSPGAASYTAKGLVQIDTDSTTSGLNITTGVLSLPNLVTAGSVGGTSTVPVITYDSKGRLTGVSTAAVNDNSKLPLAGGAMSGSIDMGNQNITNAASVAASNISTRNVLLSDSDSNTITLRAPTDVTSSNYSLTFPATAGSSGNVLSTDGSGNLSWIPPTTGSITDVTSANTFITINTPSTGVKEVEANVGTGTNTLAAGDDYRIVNAVQQSAYTSDLASVDTCTGSEKPSWSTISDAWECVAISGFLTTAEGFAQGGNNFGSAATLGTNDAFDLNFETDATTKMTILASGNVGVGTAAPLGRLHTEDTLLNQASCPVGYTIADYDADAVADDCRAVGIVAFPNGHVSIGTASQNADDVQLNVHTEEKTTYLQIINSNSTTNHHFPAFRAMNYMGTSATNSGHPRLVLQNNRGSSTSVTPILNGDTIGAVEAWGSRETDPILTNLSSQIVFKATEDFSSTAGGGSIDFRTAANGTNNPESRMIIGHNGNVGIGTTTPTIKLDVIGDARAGGVQLRNISGLPTITSNASLTLKPAENENLNLQTADGTTTLRMNPTTGVKIYGSSTPYSGAAGLKGFGICSGNSVANLTANSATSSSFTITSCTDLTTGVHVTCSPNIAPSSSTCFWRSQVTATGTITVTILNTNSTTQTCFSDSTTVNWRCAIFN